MAHSTILGENPKLPIINKISAKIQEETKNLKTFDLKSTTEDACLISRGRQFPSLTILFMKINFHKLVRAYIHGYIHTNFIVAP